MPPTATQPEEVPDPAQNNPTDAGEPATETGVAPETAPTPEPSETATPNVVPEPVTESFPPETAPETPTAAIPLEAPTLLSPDTAAPDSPVLRSFNPIREEQAAMGSQPEFGAIQFQMSGSTKQATSPGIPTRSMALTGESPLEMEAATPPLNTTFSAPEMGMTNEKSGDEVLLFSEESVATDSAAAMASPGYPSPQTAAIPAINPQPDPLLPAEETPGADASVAPEAASPATPPASTISEPESDEAYTVVRVFYGTDRNAITDSEADSAFPLGWSMATALAAVFTSLVGWATLRSRRRSLRWAALGGLTCTALPAGATMLTIQRQANTATETESAEASTAVRKIAYGNQRGVLEYGACDVSIPKIHEVGQLEAPSIFRLDFQETPERHVVLMGIEPMENATFFQKVSTRVNQAEDKSAFVFVHGFNVTFEDAARRTAQIAYDLHFDGVPIFFSWPSQGGLFKYTIDETNIVWTVPHLRQFLTEVAEQSGAKRIHLVAHSMGNRALTSALRDLSFLPKDKRPHFNEVVLTAPDIDAEVFKRDIAPYIVQTADRVTLYASSNDTALAYSKTVHGYPRAGDSGQELLILPGMETVDVSEVDTSLLGHSYYGSNETVLADLVEVLRKSLPPAERRWLRSAQLGQFEYWVFQR